MGVAPKAIKHAVMVTLGASSVMFEVARALTWVITWSEVADVAGADRRVPQSRKAAATARSARTNSADRKTSPQGVGGKNQGPS